MAELEPQIKDPDERAELAARARRVSPDLAYAIEARVRERIARHHEQEEELAEELEEVELEHEPTPVSVHRPPKRHRSRGRPDADAEYECQLTQTNQLGETANFLWCENGRHPWKVAKKRGPQPRNCPDHLTPKEVS